MGVKGLVGVTAQQFPEVVGDGSAHMTPAYAASVKNR